MKNLEKYKNDLSDLIDRGNRLMYSMRYECNNEEFRKSVENQLGVKAENFLEDLPNFFKEYQSWYSESQALIRQLLPNRLADFCDYYEVPKNRKELTYESYRISDYLLRLGLTDSTRNEIVVGLDAAIPKFGQQLSIVKAIKGRFESSIFEIEQLVQADLFDSELEASKVLIRNGFFRAAGALAGVVMERYLAQVCKNHQINIRKKNPSISDFNDKLRDAEIIDFPRWRLNQHLGDIRNLCAHDKATEPTREQVTDLVNGVAKLTKTLY